MADNNNNDEAVAENESSITYIDTKIVLLQSDNPKEKLFNIIFHDFESLPSEKGDYAVSNEFSCFGNYWQVGIYPGGDQKSLSEGMVTVFLERCSEGRDLTVKYSIGLVAEEYRISRQSRSIFDADINIWDFGDFCFLDEITGGEDNEGYLLVDGALTIRVSMELDEFIPKNPTSSLILKLFDDENSADIAFEICEQQQKSESERDRKRAKISTANNVVYHAHRLILQHYSPELSALCATSDGMAPIIITDVKPEIFRHLLYYVYGGEISDEEFVDNEKGFINAANKYGVTNLKLEAEVWYTKNTEITIDNVIDNLLYADAMNCALLKESVMDFIVENKEKVMQRVSFQDVPGDVCKDLLAAVSRYYEEKDSATSGDGDDDGDETDVEKTYSKMRIRDLREKLNDKGLDIDGSREALIANLKEHS